MKILMEQRVTTCYTEAFMKELEDDFAKIAAKLANPPAIANAIFDALPKIADVKRKEMGAKVLVFNDCTSFLKDGADPKANVIELACFDQSARIESFAKMVTEKAWRNGDIAGAQLLNRVSYSESMMELMVGGGNEEALVAQNKLNELKAQWKAEKAKSTPPTPPKGKG